jgi:hypothetical protein
MARCSTRRDHLRSAARDNGADSQSVPFGQQRAELVDLQVDFRVPLQPGNVYAIFASVKFAELGAIGGLGTPVGSRQRTTRYVHAFVVETADLDWGDETGAVVTKTGAVVTKAGATVHATAHGILKDAVYMSEEDYAAGRLFRTQR